MARGPFDPAFEELPATIPVFPLAGVLLLPHGRLPLNIFEPRYLAMTCDALKAERLIGMIQPAEAERPGHVPALRAVGCVGRITAFSETDDGRYLITLAGLARFRVAEELPTVSGYRRVRPDFAPFAADMAETPPLELDRARLLRALKGYLHQKGIKADWQQIERSADGALVTSLAMVCPFEPQEKQALLEAATPTERGRVLTALIEMALLGGASGGGGDSARH
ncbi:MAG: LON peptidase substrate-binding domain-containing protein [Pseudomonadota bacterium]